MEIQLGPLRFSTDNPKMRTPSGTMVEKGEHGVSEKDRWSSDYLRTYQSWLGQFDPEKIGLSTIKKMRTHPAIALGMQIIVAPLVNAKWDIICADQERRAFLKAVMKDIYVDVMLASLTSIEFGFAAFTKQWDVYRPVDENGKEVWKSDTIDPVVVTKVKQLDPASVKPLIVLDEFKGIIQAGTGPIDPMYSAWITHAKHRVFGNMWGWPLLVNAYKLWWSSNYRYALRDRHIEDRVSPPLVIRHPPGYYEDETGAKKFFRDAALAVGRAIRGGETVALSSEVLGDDTEKLTQLYKWKAEYLQGGENIQAFIQLDEADDLRMLMSLLIPPQAVLNTKGGLGSQAVAESLGNLFWDTEVIRAVEITNQLTKYLVQPMNELNFGPGPKATLQATAFLKSDIQLVSEMFKIVANRQDLDPSKMLDWQSMADLVGLPWVEGGGVIVKPPEVTPTPEWAKGLVSPEEEGSE